MRIIKNKWIAGGSILLAAIVIVCIVTAKDKVNSDDEVVYTDTDDTCEAYRDMCQATDTAHHEISSATTLRTSEKEVEESEIYEESKVSAEMVESATVEHTNKINDIANYVVEEAFTGKYEVTELEELSARLFDISKHQTTNTVWNGETTAKVMHPEQLEYLNNIAEKWYRGDLSAYQIKDMALNSAPIKTNEDMLQLTGFYQEFIGAEALFKVVDVDVAKLKFDGRRTDISEDELWQKLCDVGEDSATANYLYVKACYDEEKAATFVYYFDCKFQWINNNFQW